jgi:hypothetical protein
MDLTRRLENVKAGLLKAGSNHVAEAAPELVANIGRAEIGVLTSSSTKSGFSSSEIEGTGVSVPFFIRLWKVDMKRLAVSTLLLFFSVIPAGSAQQDEPNAQSPKALLDCYAERDRLRETVAEARKWEEWARENVPKHEKLLADYDEMRRKNDDLAADNFVLKEKMEALSSVPGQLIFWISAGSGLGLFAAFMLFKAVKRGWPLIGRASLSSPAKKQLFVLIVGATWISVSTLLASSLNNDLSAHPINLLATVGVYSLPAILFGGVCFWWIGKHQLGQKVQ